MLGWLSGIYSVLRALIDLWKIIQQFNKERRIEEIKEYEKELEAATKAQDEAKTDEEIFAAQDRIAKLKR